MGAEAAFGLRDCNAHKSERLIFLGSSFIKELAIRVPRKGYSGFRVKGPRFGV